MVVAGLSTLAAAAFIIGAMLFGVEWPVALLIIIGGAILTYWLLARMRRR
jgi:membrane protein implicated in regulation of membrane protease activity